MRLILLRHGNTFGPGEPSRCVGVNEDLPLVAEGIAQAKRAGVYLRSQLLVPDVVFCSELQRTRVFAELALQASEVGSVLPRADRRREGEPDPGVPHAARTERRGPVDACDKKEKPHRQHAEDRSDDHRDEARDLEDRAGLDPARRALDARGEDRREQLDRRADERRNRRDQPAHLVARAKTDRERGEVGLARSDHEHVGHPVASAGVEIGAKRRILAKAGHPCARSVSPPRARGTAHSAAGGGIGDGYPLIAR